MTAWLPFMDVGVDTPGLEFAIPGGTVKDEDIRNYWEAAGYRPETGRIIETEQLEELLGTGYKRIEPPLPLGSCFVFDQYVPHRTQVLDRAGHDRTALEFRIACADQGPGRHREFLGSRTADMLGARYDRDADNLTIASLSVIFPELAPAEATDRRQTG